MVQSGCGPFLFLFLLFSLGVVIPSLSFRLVARCIEFVSPSVAFIRLISLFAFKDILAGIRIVPSSAKLPSSL